LIERYSFEKGVRFLVAVEGVLVLGSSFCGSSSTLLDKP
jgi:hypothetical protein